MAQARPAAGSGRARAGRGTRGLHSREGTEPTSPEPLHSPPAQGLTDAPLPPDGHRPPLRAMPSAVAPVGSQTGFQRLLSSYRKKRCRPSAHTWAPGACTAAHPTALLVTEGVPLHPQGGPPDVCRMRLPAAKDVSAAPRSQHGAPDMGACPAPCTKLQNTREGPAASPPGAPPQGSRVRADPGEVPEASPPHPQGQADRPAAACWTAHLGQRAGRQTGPRTRTGCSRNFSTTSASAASSAALTDPILAEHPGLAGASGARPDWASVRPHSSLNISPP